MLGATCGNTIEDSTRDMPGDRLNKNTQSYDTSDYAESSMTDEVHKVQEDRARSFLQDFLHGKNSQQTQHQNVTTKCTTDKSNKIGNLNPALQINSHFEELKTRQKEDQKQFHQKLMQELSTSAGRMRASPSFVNTGNNFIVGK